MSDIDWNLNENNYLQDQTKNFKYFSEFTETSSHSNLLRKKRGKSGLLQISDFEIPTLESENLNKIDVIEDPVACRKKKHSRKAKNSRSKKKNKLNQAILDQDFDLSKAYFYKRLAKEQEDRVVTHLTNCLEVDTSPADILSYLKSFIGIDKAKKSLENIQSRLEANFQENLTEKRFRRFMSINKVIREHYYCFKPNIFECHFFPNKENENKLVNMIRTCKKTLDIAIFTLTNTKISAAVREVHSRGVQVRLLADREQAKVISGDVYSLAARNVPVKMSNSSGFLMHNKFVVLDKSVVLTGSLNFTSKGINLNKENVIFLENKALAKAYSEEFDKLWTESAVLVCKEKAKTLIKEAEERVEGMKHKRKNNADRKKLLKSIGDTEIQIRREDGNKVSFSNRDENCTIF